MVMVLYRSWAVDWYHHHLAALFQGQGSLVAAGHKNKNHSSLPGEACEQAVVLKTCGMLNALGSFVFPIT